MAASRRRGDSKTDQGEVACVVVVLLRGSPGTACLQPAWAVGPAQGAVEHVLDVHDASANVQAVSQGALPMLVYLCSVSSQLSMLGRQKGR